ncbi:BppU family phage baseplate upper protein [Staphylococcus succinus]|uniref:BppU family phage baseplate upper protein n=1 Tax=Staphylococcus succinus TaxID=61015 RepID=UPI001C04881E|nr:BppU family phage baseplate upper protein [Staphylococcus succinus]MBU0437749.1 BppU family phage baseplate upper protein [Staphylococcus succinus]
MTNGIDKKALFKLASEPYLKPISDLGFGFYNLDENTAILRFQLYNDKGPLLISKNNLTAYAYFESTNGSVSDVIELEIEDEFKGIVTITLDSAFLHACTDTTVTGQAYIGVNNVKGNPQYNEVAVFREFKFEVADALINKTSSVTKIEYIRMFSQLKQRIEQQVKDIEAAIANGADYVAEMKSVLQQGIETLNTIVNEGKTDIQAFINQAKMDLTKVKDDAISDIATLSNNTKTSIQNTADTANSSVKIASDEAVSHVDSKVAEFNKTVEENGFITPDKLNEDINNLEWQKYKVTNDDGSYTLIAMDSDLDAYHNLKPGNYYTTSTPITAASSTAGFTTVITRGSNIVKHIIYRPYNSKQVWMKRFYNTWNDWERLDSTQTDTGWVEFNLINGAESNTEYSDRNGFKCAYRTIVNGNVIERCLRINGSNFVPGQTIANLPSGFCKNAQTFPVRIPTKYAGGYLVIEPTGNVKFYINGDSSAWVSTDYAYGEMSWKD